MRRRLTAALAGTVVLLTGGAVVGTASSGHGDTSRTSVSPGPAAAAHAPSTPPAPLPLVLVSGRDDHGELASAEVAVYAAPGSRVPRGQVRDGTLARVVGVEGTWLRVRAVEGPPVEGWLDDFYLRREVHLVGPAPSCRVSLEGRALPAGDQVVVLGLEAGRARVRTVGTSATGWVDRTAVHELAPREGCGAAPAHESASHHH